MPKLAATLGRYAGPVVVPTIVDKTGIATTVLPDDKLGILLVGVRPDLIAAAFRLEAGALTVMSADTKFSKNKGTPNQYNCYFEGGFFCVQNNVADGKTISVSLYGI